MTPGQNSQRSTELEALHEIADRLRSIETRFDRFDVAFEQYVVDQRTIMLALFGNPADLERAPGIVMKVDRLERSVKAASGHWTRFRGLIYTVLGSAAGGFGTWLWHLISTSNKGTP